MQMFDLNPFAAYKYPPSLSKKHKVKVRYGRPKKHCTFPHDAQRQMRGVQPLKRSASSIWHLGVKPQPSSSRSSDALARAYFFASSPRHSDKIAGEVPSMGSHSREMGGRIWVLRYHS